MAPEIEAITLDLDDTLWPVGPVIAHADRMLHEWLERHAPAVAAALPPERFATYRREVAAQRPEIAHDYTALRLTAIAQALIAHGCDDRLAHPAMEVFLAARQEVELYPDTIPALERLAARFRLASLSNGNADIALIGIDRWFECAVSARSAGHSKPDPRIFHAACERLGVAPGRVLHVGDDAELDVRGALRAGLHAVWINRSGARWDGEPGVRGFTDLAALCEWLAV